MNDRAGARICARQKINRETGKNAIDGSRNRRIVGERTTEQANDPPSRYHRQGHPRHRG